MGSITWGQEVAEVYDKTYAAKFEPSVLDPIVDLLAELARGGPALEFAVGTGRVALPLSARGLAVHGIERRRESKSHAARDHWIAEGVFDRSVITRPRICGRLSSLTGSQAAAWSS